MADTVATYAFTEKENYEAAKDKINSELDGYSWEGIQQAVIICCIFWTIVNATVTDTDFF